MRSICVTLGIHAPTNVSRNRTILDAPAMAPPPQDGFPTGGTPDYGVSALGRVDINML